MWTSCGLNWFQCTERQLIPSLPSFVPLTQPQSLSLFPIHSIRIFSCCWFLFNDQLEDLFKWLHSTTNILPLTLSFDRLCCWFPFLQNLAPLFFFSLSLFLLPCCRERNLTFPVRFRLQLLVVKKRPLLIHSWGGEGERNKIVFWTAENAQSQMLCPCYSLSKKEARREEEQPRANFMRNDFLLSYHSVLSSLSLSWKIFFPSSPVITVWKFYQ